MSGNNSKRVFTLILVSGDAIILIISWFLSYFARQRLHEVFGYPVNPLSDYINSLPFIVIPWMLTNTYYGLYKRRKDITPFEEIEIFFKSIFLGTTIVMAIAFIFKEFNLGRSVLFIFTMFNTILLGIFRTLIHRWEKHLKEKGKLEVKGVIIGAGFTGVRLLQKLQDHPEIGFSIVGFIDSDPEKQGKIIGKTPVLGGIDILEDVIKDKGVDEVILAIPSMQTDMVMNLMTRLEKHNVRFRVVSDVFQVLKKETTIDAIEEFPIYEIGTGKTSFYYNVTKRIFDLFASIIILLLTIPLWLVIAIAIKLDSEGPVFFLQERVGYRGKKFTLYKFRTMYKNVHPYEEAPRDKGDTRITKIGRFLRNTSFDELPQILNVIKGEMSLVGPRPEMPFIVEKYSEWEKKRLEAKPGITGLWQILGRKDLPLAENLEYDFYYIKNRSFLFDMVILLKTIPAVFKRKGAY